MRVQLDARRPSFFNDLLPPGGWQYSTFATATSVGASPLCVLVFTAKTAHDFWVTDTANVTAPKCLVHSNGHIEVSGGRIEAARTEAVLSASGDISPAPVTDVPEIVDPFASLPIPAAPKCTGSTKKMDIAATSGTVTLPAGIHCGQIQLSGTAVLTLLPGEHRFASGQLEVKDNARLTGVDVVLIVDKSWQTSFEDNATVSLSGRQSGLLAGFVMVADRGNTQPFTISASHVDRLEGVLYVPSAELRISSQGAVASQSNWTVIVAKNLRLTGNPDLVMNVDYGASDVGVPSGVGPRDGAVRLVE